MATMGRLMPSFVATVQLADGKVYVLAAAWNRARNTGQYTLYDGVAFARGPVVEVESRADLSENEFHAATRRLLTRRVESLIVKTVE